jgi:hypothetical protein
VEDLDHLCSRFDSWINRAHSSDVTIARDTDSAHDWSQDPCRSAARSEAVHEVANGTKQGARSYSKTAGDGIVPPAEKRESPANEHRYKEEQLKTECPTGPRILRLFRASKVVVSAALLRELRRLPERQVAAHPDKTHRSSPSVRQDWSPSCFSRANKLYTQECCRAARP